MENLLAQADIPPINNPVLPSLANKPPEQAFGTMVAGIVGFLLVLASIWAFLQILLAGINWISSGGDKSKLEAAQQRITQGIIGLFIVFAAWGIFLVLLRFLGIIQQSPTGEIQLKIPQIF